MSIFDDVKNIVKKPFDKGKDAVEKPVDEVKDQVEKLKKELEREVNIELSWNNVGEDKEELLKKIGGLSSAPPKTREDIKYMIKLLAPDTVKLKVSAPWIALGVDEALDEIDEFCEEVGIFDVTHEHKG